MKLSEARQRLADAQQQLTAATDAAGAAQEQHQKILGIAARHAELRSQLDAAQAAHSQALVEWASKGGEGSAPAAPATIEKLAKEIATAARQAESADAAARQLEPTLDAARRDAVAAMQRVREARRGVLLEAAQPLIAEYRDASARTLALREHVLGLQAIAGELRDEVPRVGDVTGTIAHEMNFRPILAPGGAEQSRQAWRDFIRALFADASAELGEGPDAIDADEHLRQRAA
ncbi:MAG TPA: hypothetical protein VFJ87_04895 [Rhodanobacteraceae bacterium]|nr:hypothetical protein [Rhodanobacteraceae bacterium]